MLTYLAEIWHKSMPNSQFILIDFVRFPSIFK
ncbi:hypothetical protein SVI_0629 [Shewanella violacea DSS12]|uniref:Uncharacterized protein n=1 Tax=Shewanella violacea (strain JCM 10179 / CIP 106290 / LMG 19151 / DSS12) TaxID=637905 RepID=D4ZG01_SHEVD|nr:hypothetical protein SVI_0629 [Shewanella violacea DSS12]